MEHQKQQILQQAESLFLRYGIKSVTMDDLSKEMGVSKKTLYQYIENKADLIGQIILNHVEQETNCINDICGQTQNAIEQMLGIGMYAVQQLGKVSPTVVYDLKKYYRKSWEMMETLHREHVYLVIVENIKKGIKEGLYRENVNADIVAKLYVGKTFLLVDEEIFPHKDYDRTSLFREFIFYHLFGIVTQKGLKTFEKLIPKYLTT